MRSFDAWEGRSLTTSATLAAAIILVGTIARRYTNVFSLLRMLCTWMGVDRIRISNHTGRMGRLQKGDRFLWEESIFEVVGQEVMWERESESCVRLVLSNVLDCSSDPHELILHAQTEPTIRLTGKLRMNTTKGTQEIEVCNDEIVPLRHRDTAHD